MDPGALRVDAPNVPKDSGGSKVPLPVGGSEKVSVDSAVGTVSNAAQMSGTITGNPSFAGAVSTRILNGTRVSTNYNWPSATASAAIHAGAFSVITPSWTEIPAGLTSGAMSRVSISGTTVTWVSGDKFNPSWTNKSVSINDHTYTIASCASVTSCSLTAGYTGSTTYGPYMSVSFPTSVYISGGSGSPEAMTIVGVGASECPGGTALSICGIPRQTHTGIYTLQSATAGIQEAINSLVGAGGQVLIPAGTYHIYATIDSLNNSTEVFGQGKAASELVDHVAGGAAAMLVEGNFSSYHDFGVIGSSKTGNLLAYWDVGGSGQWGQTRFVNLELIQSTGTGTSITGSDMRATGFYSSGATGYTFESNLVEGCVQGIQIDFNGGAGADGTIFAGNHLTDNTSDAVYLVNTANVAFVGNRIDFNAGIGFHAVSGSGVTFSGNYMENNSGGSIKVDQTALGWSIIGNELSQYDGAGAAVISISPKPASYTPSQGVHISGNYFLLTGHNTTATVTAYVSGGFTHSVVESNVFDLASGVTQPGYGVWLFNGGNAGAALDNAIANNAGGPNGAPANLVYDQPAAVTIPNANPDAVSYVQAGQIVNGGLAVSGGSGHETQILAGPMGFAAIGGFGVGKSWRVRVGDGTGWSGCFAKYASGAWSDLGCLLDTGIFKWGSSSQFQVDATGNVTAGVVNATTLEQNGSPAIYTAQTFSNGSAQSTFPSGVTANQLSLYAVEIPTALQASKISYWVNAGDATTTDAYSLGIYNSSGTLVAHGAPVDWQGSGTARTDSLVEGTVTLPAGMYFIGLTGNAGTATLYSVCGTQKSFVDFASSSYAATTAGALPTTITAPTLAPAQGCAPYIFLNK